MTPTDDIQFNEALRLIAALIDLAVEHGADGDLINTARVFLEFDV